MTLRPSSRVVWQLLACVLVAGCFVSSASDDPARPPAGAATDAALHDSGSDSTLLEHVTDAGALIPSEAGTYQDAGAEVATHPPLTVVSTLPTASANDVMPGGVVSVTFSEPVDPASVTSETFFVTPSDENDQVLSGTFQVNGATVTFTPDQPIEAGRAYTATITSDVRASAQDDGIDDAHVWTFATLPEPIVIGITPLQNKVGVGTASTVSVSFSLTLAAGTLVAQATSGACSGSFQLRKPGGDCVGGTLASSDNETFVFTPAAPLADDTRHRVFILAEATSALGVPARLYAMYPGFLTTRSASDARVIFETNDVSPNFGGAAGADVVCSTPSFKTPPGVTSARAILSDATRTACTVPNCGSGNVQTNWALHPNATYVRANGTFLFTTNGNGIVTSYPMGDSISGAGKNFWSALSSDWTSSTPNCANWTSTAPAPGEDCSTSPNCGGVGWDATTNDSWIAGGKLPCSAQRPLVCAEW